MGCGASTAAPAGGLALLAEATEKRTQEKVLSSPSGLMARTLKQNTRDSLLDAAEAELQTEKAYSHSLTPSEDDEKFELTDKGPLGIEFVKHIAVVGEPDDDSDADDDATPAEDAAGSTAEVVTVLAIAADSIGAATGIQPGMVLVDVHNQSVRGKPYADARAILAHHGAKRPLVLTFASGRIGPIELSLAEMNDIKDSLAQEDIGEEEKAHLQSRLVVLEAAKAERDAEWEEKRLAGEAKMKEYLTSLQRDVMFEWSHQAKNLRRERHEALVVKLRAKFGNNTLSQAVVCWRENVVEIRVQRQLDLERTSATIMQTVLRGLQLRRYHVTRRLAVIQDQAVSRGWSQRKELARLNRAAATIQANFRGRKWRELMLTRKPGRGLLRLPEDDQSKLLEVGAAPKRAVAGGSTKQQLRKRVSQQRLAARSNRSKSSADLQVQENLQENLQAHTIEPPPPNQVVVAEETKRLKRSLSKEIAAPGMSEEAIQSRVEQRYLEMQAQETVGELQSHAENLSVRVDGPASGVYRVAIHALRWIHDQKPTSHMVHELMVVGAGPALVSLGEEQSNVELQQELAWTLTNLTGVASSTDIQHLVDCGVIQHLVMMLFHSDGDVREQSTVALGNTIAESTIHRDAALEEGALPPLLVHAQSADGAEWLADYQPPEGRAVHHWARRIARTMMNLCTGEPPADYGEVHQALPLLGRLLLDCHDNDVLDNVLVTLVALTQGSRENVQAVLQCQPQASTFVSTTWKKKETTLGWDDPTDKSISAKLVHILSHPDKPIRARALVVIANICVASSYVVTGDDSEVQSMLDAGLLPKLLVLMHGELETDHAMISLCCHILGNIAAGNKTQYLTLITADHTSRVTPVGRFVPLLCGFLQSCVFAIDFHRKIMVESAWVLYNITAHHTCVPQLEMLLRDGILRLFRGGDAVIAPALVTSDLTGECLIPSLDAFINLLTAIKSRYRLHAEAEAEAERRRKMYAAMRPPPPDPRIEQMDRLVKQLERDRLGGLQKRAREEGITEKAIDQILCSDEPKVGLIAAIVELAYPPPEPEPEEESEEEEYHQPETLQRTPSMRLAGKMDSQTNSALSTTLGKSVDDCCYNCGKSGHYARQCPKPLSNVGHGEILPEADDSLELLVHVSSHHPLSVVRERAGFMLCQFCGFAPTAVQKLYELAKLEHGDPEALALADQLKFEMSRTKSVFSTVVLTDVEAAKRIQAAQRGRAARMMLRKRKPGRGEVRQPESELDMALATGQRRPALALGDQPLRKSFRHGDTESGYTRKRSRPESAEKFEKSQSKTATAKARGVSRGMSQRAIMPPPPSPAGTTASASSAAATSANPSGRSRSRTMSSNNVEANVMRQLETLRGMLNTLQTLPPESALGEQILQSAATAFASLRKLHDGQASASNGDLLPMPSPYEDPRIDDEGVFPLLVAFLDPRVPAVLQIEAAHTLTNLTGGAGSDATDMIVQSGGVPAMLRLLLSPSGDVREQVVWLLANVAADGGVWRIALLEARVELPHNQGLIGCVQLLVRHAESAEAQAEHDRLGRLGLRKVDAFTEVGQFLEHVAYTDAKKQTRFLHHWGRRVARALANLCAVRVTGEPAPKLATLKPALPLLGRLLVTDDKEVLDYALLALDAIAGAVPADGKDTHLAIRAILRCCDEVKRGVVVNRSSEMAERLVALLAYPLVSVRARALCVVAKLCASSGHVVIGDDAEVTELIEAGLLEALLLLLHADTHTEACILRHSLRVLANVCSGTRAHLQAVFALDSHTRRTPHGRFFPLVCNLIKSCSIATQGDLIEEAVWVITNATHLFARAPKRRKSHQAWRPEVADERPSHLELMRRQGCWDVLVTIMSPSIAAMDRQGIVLTPALEALHNMLLAWRREDPDACAVALPAVYLQRIVDKHPDYLQRRSAAAVLEEFGAPS